MSRVSVLTHEGSVSLLLCCVWVLFGLALGGRTFISFLSYASLATPNVVLDDINPLVEMNENAFEAQASKMRVENPR